MGVPVVSPSGEATEVPVEAIDQFRAMGYTPIAKSDELGALTEQARAPEDTIGGAITAAGTSALSGATLGLSDVALRGVLNKGDLEYVAQQREAHPILSAGGNIVGAVAAAPFTGGESLEGEAAGLTAREALGALPAARAVELGQGIKGAIGDALPGVVGRVAGSAAEGAAVGALQNVGNYIGDVALGNRDLSAEAFLAEVGNGAKWGGLAGGALGATERGLVKVRSLFPTDEIGTGKAAEMANRQAMDDVQSHLQATEAAAKAARDEVERIKYEQGKTVADARLQSTRMRAAQAQQQLEIAKAKDNLDTAIGARDAAKDFLDRQGAAADTAADGAQRAVDSSVASQADAAGARATRLSQLADEVERTGAEVKRIATPDELMAEWRQKYPSGAVDYDAANTAARRGKLRKWADGFEPDDEEGAAVKAYFQTDKDPVDVGRATNAPDDVKKIANEVAEQSARRGYLDGLANGTNVSGDGNELMARAIYASRKEAAKALDDVYARWAAGESTAQLAGLVEKPRPFLDVAHDAIEAIGAHEKANADLVRELGPAAPPQAAQLGAAYDSAVDKASAAHAETTARAVDDAAANPASREPDDIAKARSVLDEHRQKLTELRMQSLQQKADAAKLLVGHEEALSTASTKADAAEDDLSKAREAAKAKNKPSAAPTDKVGALSRLSKFGAVLEAARTLGVPGIPDVHSIPVVGPILSLFLKAKAIKMAMSKGGAAIPETVEARVAAHAARARNAMAKAIDVAIAESAQMRRGAEIAAPRAADVLSHGVFGTTGEKHDGTIDEAAMARAAEIATAVSSPDDVQRQMRQLIPTTDPALGDSLLAVTQRKLQYLHDHAPAVPPPDPLGAKTPPIAIGEAERFARVTRAAEHPMSILDDLRDGTLTSEAVDAVRTIYPNLYTKMQMLALNAAAGTEVPYKTRVQIGILFGGDTDASLKNLSVLQGHPSATPQQMQQPSAPQAAPPAPSIAGNPNFASLYQTALDRRAQKLGG